MDRKIYIVKNVGKKTKKNALILLRRLSYMDYCGFDLDIISISENQEQSFMLLEHF